MADKQINELPAVVSLAADDELPLWDEDAGATKKATVAQVQGVAPVQSVSDTDSVDLELSGAGDLTAAVRRKAGGHIAEDAGGLSVDEASADQEGVAELATNAEVQAGSDTERIVTPAGLSSRTATTDRTGIAELATNAEVQAGSDTERIVTPAGLQACTATEDRKGVAELATTTEVQTGTDTERIVTPAGLRADVPATPAASRGVRLNANGDCLLPPGGDTLVDGNTDVDTGLGYLLACLLGSLSKYTTGQGWLAASGLGWRKKNDGIWTTWALGTGSGTYRGDEFLVDNYAGGSEQWDDVNTGSGAASPNSVEVEGSCLFLTGNKSGDTSPYGAAIRFQMSSSDNPVIDAKLASIDMRYYRAAGVTIDWACGAGVFNAGYTDGIMAWLIVPETIADGSQTYQATLAFKRYYHASAVWEPRAADSSPWTHANWSTLIDWTIPLVFPIHVRMQAIGASDYVYCDIGVGGSIYHVLDRPAAVSNALDTYVNVVLFQSYFPATAGRQMSIWDYVRAYDAD